jgi:hypothetical protein
MWDGQFALQMMQGLQILSGHWNFTEKVINCIEESLIKRMKTLAGNAELDKLDERVFLIQYIHI